MPYLCCCRDRVRAITEQVLPLAELPSEEAAAITTAVAGRDLPKAGELDSLYSKVLEMCTCCKAHASSCKCGVLAAAPSLHVCLIKQTPCIYIAVKLDGAQQQIIATNSRPSARP
jgi:hypothetical protein